MRGRLQLLIDQLPQSLWPIPALGVVTAVVAHVILLSIDHRLDEETARWFVFGGGAGSARSVLETMATSMLSMTTVVFSITMLVLQLAASQLSPRVLSTFLRDRRNQVVLALFISTYAYVLLTLREIRDDFVPGLSVWAAFVAVMLSVAAFVYYVHHIAQSIRVVTVVQRVANDARRAIERLYPSAIGEPAPVEAVHGLPEGEPDRTYRWPAASGVVVSVRDEELARICRESGAFVRLRVAIGDFVGRGSRIAMAWGEDAPEDDALLGTIVVGAERTVSQDALYGFRQLVDIAVRALSPGVNEPTTATQVLDQLHGLLLELSEREIPPSVRADEHGRSFLELPRPGWDAYVALSLDEIRVDGRDSVQVRRRLRVLIEDLIERAPESRLPSLRRQWRQLDAIEATLPAHQRSVLGPPQGHAPST
ncbi:MAG: DUF2254 domain-containing protein [Dehalococcoidia bacterium]